MCVCMFAYVFVYCAYKCACVSMYVCSYLCAVYVYICVFVNAYVCCMCVLLYHCFLSLNSLKFMDTDTELSD